jgi:hypothetical protein
MMPRLPALLLLALASLAPRAVAQDAGAGGDAEPPEIAAAHGAAGVPLAAIDGLGRYAIPTLAFRPARLAPGSTGRMFVLLAILPGSVVKPERLELDYSGRQGPAALGPSTVTPPNLGSLEPAFAGEPIYDNTITFEVPLTIDRDAASGDHLLKAAVAADVFDGQSGQPRGRYSAEVTGRLTVAAEAPAPRDLASAPEVAVVERRPGRDPVEPAESGAIDAAPSTGVQAVELAAQEPTGRPRGADDAAPRTPFPATLVVLIGTALVLVFGALMLALGRR